MKKIFSTSAYGTNPRYVVGAHRQYELCKKYYPDWEYRLYTDDPSLYKDLPDADIRHCTQGHGVFWRFLPLFEYDNHITIVRDADGRVTLREELAVEDWLRSDKTFHRFQDHVAHYEFPVIACAFGYKGKLPDNLREIMENFMYNTNYYTNDQVFLRDYVWPYVEQNTLTHEMNSGWFGSTRKLLKNRFSFCGNGYDENDLPLYPATMEEMNGYQPRAEFKFDEGELRV
jgi:hypothetical protein